MSLHIFLSQIVKLFLFPELYLGLFMGHTLYRLIKRPSNQSRVVVPWSLWVFLLLTAFFSSPIIHLLAQRYHQLIPATPQPLQKKQAAVVLGGGTLHFDRERNQAVYYREIARFLESLRLYKHRTVEKLVLSGGDPGALPQNFQGEIDSQLQLALDLGLPRQDIHLETKSLNTYQQAVYLKTLLDHWKIEDFYLVTSYSHMPRAYLTFLERGLRPTPYPVGPIANSTSFQFSHFKLWRIYLHEWVGVVGYLLFGHISPDTLTLSRHPPKDIPRD